MKDTLVSVAISAVSVLVALIAVYLSLRLLGKIAKFVVIAVVIALLVWLFVADNSILNTIKDLIK